MFSSVLEGAGYDVVVVGKREALRRQPATVGRIVVSVVSGRETAVRRTGRRRLWQLVARLEQGSFLGVPGTLLSARAQRLSVAALRRAHSRADALIYRLPAPILARAGSSRRPRPLDARIANLEPAVARTLDNVGADLILALDPVALFVAHDASTRGRADGARIQLAYDRARAPVADSASDRREAAVIQDVELGTAASLGLASDERWPPSLRGRVPAVYSVPLPLAASEVAVKSLIEGRDRQTTSRVVGLFLPPSLVEDLSLVEGAVSLMRSDQLVVFGSNRQLACCSQRLHDGAILLQRSPDHDDIASLLSYLDVVVCPSTWSLDIPPSTMAVASAGHRHALVASRKVTDELGFGVGVESALPKTLAAAVDRAATVTGAAARIASPTASAPEFTYAGQAALFREQLNATARPKVGIGPRNGNGQAWAWAQALRRHRPGLPVEAFAVEYSSGPLAMNHGCDVSITKADWRRREWQKWWAHRLRTQFGHLLIEQGLTACGWLHGRSYFDDLPPLLESGMNVGLVFRGSEIRDPAAHAARERWSPFADPDDPFTAELQALVKEPRRKLQDFDVPVFVTTLDLLDDVPSATWLPQVLDLEEWWPGPRVLARERPVVLHAPPRSEQMKGSHWVDEACQPLHDAGVIEYRRLHRVPFAEMPSRLRGADIVIDQVALGSYGVLALQAMACERLVIGHVSERVRERLTDTIPVLEAEPPDLGRVLEDALADRTWAASIGRSGRDYVRRYHSGGESAHRLLCHLLDE